MSPAAPVDDPWAALRPTPDLRRLLTLRDEWRRATDRDYRRWLEDALGDEMLRQKGPRVAGLHMRPRYRAHLRNSGDEQARRSLAEWLTGRGHDPRVGRVDSALGCVVAQALATGVDLPSIIDWDIHFQVSEIGKKLGRTARGR